MHARDIAAGRVRQNAGSAALAAALMIGFGFFTDPQHIGSDLFSVGARLFYFTLRVGGVLLALVAALSLTGRPFVLLIDALLSAAIGVVLVASGGLTLYDGGGFQSVLALIFGAMFIGAGRRNGLEFQQIREQQGSPGVAGSDPNFDKRYEQARAQPPGDSLASRLVDRSAAPEQSGRLAPEETGALDAEAVPPREPEASPEDLWTLRDDGPSGAQATLDETPSETQPEDKAAAPPEHETTDAPDGFLASFADDDQGPD